MSAPSADDPLFTAAAQEAPFVTGDADDTGTFFVASTAVDGAGPPYETERVRAGGAVSRAVEDPGLLETA